jgi:N-acetylmuramic acid 6-phosphate etherase
MILEVKMEGSLGNLTTEQVNKNSSHIDICSTNRILELINDEDINVPLIVKKVITNIEKAVDIIFEKLKKGGRLFYVGAGTSGRMGILDASECPPTYGTDPELVQGIIAGGYEAVFRAVEGAEDNEALGRQVIYDKNITESDVIVGITASGQAPFVLGVIREAKKIGAVTIGISNNYDSQLKNEADLEITPIVGPEVVMGSTRMKAGTSQKLVLNMITTAVMIKLGKVYKNLMVDLKPTNKKLTDRCIRIVMYATGVAYETAEDFLNRSGYSPKLAIVMIETGCSSEVCEKLLNDADGFVTRAIEAGMKLAN